MSARPGLDADLLVAGGGPAGLAVAIAAARRGLSVTVLEPRAGALDKACGEGLMPAAVRALDELGVQVTGRPFVGIRYLQGARAVEGRFRDRPGLGVRRTALSAALQARASELGVRFVPLRAEGVRQEPERVLAAGLAARWLVAADGLHSPLRRALGLARPARRLSRFGVRRHFALAPWSEQVEVHWAPDAEAYVTPVAGDLVGVAILFQRAGGDRSWGALLARFPALLQRLGGPAAAEAAAVTPARGAGPFAQGARRRVLGRVLLAGDAAGYLDPLTGEGVRLSLESAPALVACLLADRPRDWERAWWRLARRSWWLTAGLLLWARSPLRGAVVPALSRAPRLFGLGLRLLAE